MGSWYRALHRLNVAIDFVLPDADLNRYRLVIAPLLYMLRPGAAANLERFVKEGGVFLTTFFSGIVDQNDLVIPGGYPAALRKMLGMYIEEFDPWTPQMTNDVVIQEGPLQGTYPCTLWGEVIHLEGAQALGFFASDYYAQGPALTVHRFGEGQAYYIATQGNDKLLGKLTHTLCQEAAISPVMNVPEGVEATTRVQADGPILHFLLNYNETAAQVTLPAGNLPRF